MLSDIKEPSYICKSRGELKTQQILKYFMKEA